MWNRLALYVMRFLDMWSRLALYVLRLLGTHDPSPGLENEVGGNINLCYQMVDEEADSATATGGDYDVFLSFRGLDTRQRFTDCLYEFMRNAGIRVYRDNEELQPGEKISEILRAVKSSKIFIPIFSENYASSRWCLEELACMVKSTSQSAGKKILPIFYDVDPSDVKLETKKYRSALNKLEEKYGCNLVKPWKEALTTVARIKGWHLKDQGHGQAMADITQKVLRKITTTKRYLPPNLVGIGDRIEDIKKLLDCRDTSDVRFVIIYGIGGIGKTTLANAVFNQISPRFEGHSFLSNIQESSSYGGIEKMQRKLVTDLFSYPFAETFDFDNGNNIIRERLPNKRVLLVFDGMDKKDQFMQLAKHCTSCRPGSRIIITTRDKSVFPMTKVEGSEENISTRFRKIFLYEMKEMHFDDALQLFNKLAFNTDSAPSDLHDLSREVVELSEGLPLVVEVMGSHLGCQRKADRRSTLENLKEVPREEVQQKLKISYDALDCWAQQIYLDIACFFANKKITNPMYMWKNYGFSPKDKIDVLINKSLIKIVDHDRIWMHGQLRALGREIIRQENRKKPEDRSRLWILEAPKMGTDNVVALTPRRSGHNFTPKDFVNLTNAKFLVLNGGNFAGNFENILLELRWLHWQNCPSKLQADDFVLNRLVVLKLSGDITTEHWSGWVEIMVASKLKVLKIAGSKSLIKTPRLSEFMSLERLVLKDFLSLAEIDGSIGELDQLIYLKIKWCPSLRELPKEVGRLTALRELILIQGFSVCYLPDSIGNLRLLSRLVMEDIGIVKLPDTFKELVNLKYLSLVNCTSLDSLPDAVGELKSLTQLDLSGTTIKELPPSLWNLQDLTLLINSSEIRTQNMRDLPLLEDIKDALLEEYQRKLKISYDALDYEAKQIFLDIACFFVDKKISDAMYMWEACDFFPQVKIDILIGKSLVKIVGYDRISMHNQLRVLGRKIFCQENTRKPEDHSKSWFHQMGTENVVAPTLWRMRHNFTRDDFANLTNARFLELNGGNFVGNFEYILPELRWLYWRNCPLKLQANNFVLNHLVVLKLSGNIITKEWSRWIEIMVPSKLKVLHLAKSISLIKTPYFSEFMNLERLVLKDFPRLAEIDRSIGKLERLIYFKIKRCPCLRELPKEIGCASGLRELILIEGSSVCYLPDCIGNLRLLSRLVMEDTGLVELPDTIKGLVDLEHLCLANCTRLNSLSDAVGELKSLIELDLSGTTIEELPPSLWNLQALTLLMKGSKIQAQLTGCLLLMRDIEHHLDPGRKLGPDDRFNDAKISVRLPDYPMEILNQGSSTVVAPGFHEHHFSGRCPPKISARVIFTGVSDSRIYIAAEVPLWNTGIMSSSEPIRYFKNVILMLASWLKRKRVSKWKHDFHKKDEVLLSLEFCDHCMSITSEIGGFSPSPLCLESVDPSPQLSVMVTMSFSGQCHSDDITCWVEDLEILTEFSLPSLRSHSLLLKGPCSSKKLQYSIRMFSFWHEKATQVQGSASRRSFKNCMLRRLRKTRWGRSRNKRKRNLSHWLCLDEYLDKRLLMYSGYFYACQYSLSPLPKTKLDYCLYVLEQAFASLDGPLDLKQKTRLIRESALVVEWMREIIDVETPSVQEAYQFFKEAYQFFKDMYIRMFC